MGCYTSMFQKVLIIIPCYNEEISLPIVLSELQTTVLPDAYQMKVLVINDCSKDNTKAVAQKHNTAVLNLPINLGIGGAVQTGFKYASRNNFDIAIQLDGDGQHPPAEIIKLIKAYENTAADIIIGSRFIDKEGFQSSFARRMGIKYFYRLNRIFTGNYISDSTSGFRLFNKKAIHIAADNYPDDYPEPESLIIFARAGLSIKEVPVTMSHRLGGESSISHSASLYYCIKVTIAMLFSFIRKPQ
jgi:glycosyltransferase involved in cell wall biosynthesis